MNPVSRSIESLLRFAGLLLLPLLLGACANFGVVKQFSDETKKMTATVGPEVTFASNQCARTLLMRKVVEKVDNEGVGCKELKVATDELAKHTVVIIGAYGAKLGALADGTNFDYSAELGQSKTALLALKDKDGTSAFDKEAVGAGVAIVDLLLKVATEVQRRKAVEEMVDKVDNLEKSAGYLRQFFAVPTSQQSLYGRIIRQNDQRLTDTLASLKVAEEREPIRAREWKAEIESRQLESKKRSSGEVPTAMAALLDEWIKSLREFKKDAFKPDAKEWQSQIKALSDKGKAARDAVDAL